MTTTLQPLPDLRCGCVSEGPAQLEFCESRELLTHIAHLQQQCHNSKFVIFQEGLLKGLKFYNFPRVQRRRNCSLAASFADCVMTLYLLKVHLQTLLFIPIIQKCQILSCDTLVANERYLKLYIYIYIYIYIGCPTRYRTRHFFNNFTTNEDIRRTTDTHYTHIPLHFSYNEHTPIHTSLHYLHWC